MSHLPRYTMPVLLTLCPLACKTQPPPANANHDATKRSTPKTAHLCGAWWPLAIKQLNCTDRFVEDLSAITRLSKLQVLDLSRSDVFELKPLAHLTALKTLALNHTAVRDLRPLARLTALKTLALNHTAVHDLRPLARLTALKTVELNHTKVRNLTPLRGLNRLYKLTLTNTLVGSLEGLSGLKSLRWLLVNHTAVHDLRPLRGCDLRVLSAAHTRVSEFPALSTRQLLDLDLSGTQVSTLGPLRGAPELRYLKLAETKVTGLEALRDSAHLQYLDLSNTPVRSFGPLCGQSTLTVQLSPTSSGARRAAVLAKACKEKTPKISRRR